MNVRQPSYKPGGAGHAKVLRLIEQKKGLTFEQYLLEKERMRPAVSEPRPSQEWERLFLPMYERKTTFQEPNYLPPFGGETEVAVEYKRITAYTIFRKYFSGGAASLPALELARNALQQYGLASPFNLIHSELYLVPEYHDYLFYDKQYFIFKKHQAEYLALKSVFNRLKFIEEHALALGRDSDKGRFLPREVFTTRVNYQYGLCVSLYTLAGEETVF